jgi:Type IV secretion system pilin
MPQIIDRISIIKKIILWSVIIGGLLALFIPTLVHAEIPTIDVCKESKSCLKGTDTLGNGDKNTVVSFLITVAQYLTFIGAAIAVLFAVWGGIQMITSSGDDTKYKGGIKTLQYAIIGLVLTIVAYTIVAVVASLVQTIQL